MTSRAALKGFPKQQHVGNKRDNTHQEGDNTYPKYHASTDKLKGYLVPEYIYYYWIIVFQMSVGRWDENHLSFGIRCGLY